MKRFVLVLAVLTGFATTAAAQSADTAWWARSGRDVRVYSGRLGWRKEGMLLSAGKDSIVFFPDGKRSAIPTSEVKRVEVLTSSDRMGTGIVLGFLIVGGGSAAITAVALKGHPIVAATVGTVTGVAGALVGGFIGLFHQSETWRSVPIPR